MKARLMKLSCVGATLVFIIGLGIFVSAKLSSKGLSARAFVITYTISRIEAGGNAIPEQIQIKTAKKSGEYKVRTYYLQSGKTTEFLATQNSVYEVEPDSLQYIGRPWTPEMRRAFSSITSDQPSPGFVREEQVCGLTTYVYRTQDGDEWIDQYFGAGVTGAPLKTVSYFGKGSYLISEAVNVQFRDVSDDEVKLPDLPVRFEQAEQRLMELSHGDGSKAADTLRKGIEAEKQRIEMK